MDSSSIFVGCNHDCSKGIGGFFYTNDHYAKVGGVSLQELNCLELDFLQRINWRTIPIHNPNVQQLYYHKLVEMTGQSSSNDDTEYKLTKFIMNTEQEPKEQDLSDYEEEEGDEAEDDGFYDSDEDDDEGEDEDDSEDDSDILDPRHRNGFPGDHEMEDADTVASEIPPDIPMYKYDSQGFSIDGTSSPHLKRRYSSD